MENKILVADDSPTIQKVISITLANKDYELDTAQSEDELFEKLNNLSYGLVLLDYNLSDTAAGVEIVKQINEKSPNTTVMAMLGTFDSVEDSILEEAGFSDKIVKPFESSKFIQKIESLLSDSSEIGPLDSDIFASDSSPEVEEEGSESFDSDEWSIDGPSIIEEESSLDSDNKSENSSADPLAAEMAGWGMSVPGVIGSGSEAETILPPSIEATEVVTFSEEYNEEHEEDDDEEEHEFSFSDDSNTSDNLDEHKTREVQIPEELKAESISDEETPTFPEDDDLDYPDMSTADDLVEDSDRHPQLTSLEELESFNDDNDEDLDVTDPQIIIGPSEDSPDLVNAINDEISPDDFWAADVEQEGLSEDLSEDGENGNEDLISLEDEDDDFTIDEHPTIDEGPMTTELSATSKATIDALEGINNIGPKLESENYEIGQELQNIDVNSLAQRIKTEILNELKPLIKEMVKEALEETNSETVEKVAWEVIPDLAENLIRKEVKELSQRVMDKHSLS